MNSGPRHSGKHPKFGNSEASGHSAADRNLGLACVWWWGHKSVQQNGELVAKQINKPNGKIDADRQAKKHFVILNRRTPVNWSFPGESEGSLHFNQLQARRPVLIEILVSVGAPDRAP